MEGQSIMTKRKSEIIIDIEPFIKEEPVEDEGLEGHGYYEYGDESVDDINDPEERKYDDSKTSFSEGEVSADNVKEEPVDNESEENSELNVPKSELIVHAVPSTSSQSDNMIYFEIPAINVNNCKCMGCGATFVGKDPSEYICYNCLDRKDFPNNSEDKAPANSKSDDPDYHPNNEMEKVDKKDLFKCHLCEKTCVSETELIRHLAVHRGEKPYACDSCPKKFNQWSNLMRHKTTHSDLRPFACPSCPKTFTQASYLKKHSLTHSGEKPYGCVVCEKRFSDYSTLSKHKLIHSGERPYVCSICSKTFNQLASLRRHEVIHRDEKPFQCTICYKKFAQSHHLKRHQPIHRVRYVNMSLPKYRMAPIQIVDKTPNAITHQETVHESGEMVFESNNGTMFSLVQDLNPDSSKNTLHDARYTKCSSLNYETGYDSPEISYQSYDAP